MSNQVQLYLGDCLVIAETLQNNKDYVLITDPPYGIDLGKTKGAGGKHGLLLTAYSGYEDTYENFVSQIVPRLNVFIDISIRAAVFTGPHIQEQQKANAIGGIYCPCGTGRHAWGFKTFLPVLFYGTAPDLHKGAKPNTIKSTAPAEKNGHPCPKPLAWMKWLIGLTTKPDDIVIDPFMGSGTTGVAALQLGRKFIGIEQSSEYFDIAAKRIADASRASSGLPKQLTGTASDFAGLPMFMEVV